MKRNYGLRVFRLDIKIIFIIFAILDIFCVGLGMGVPIFCILFGFPIGWYSTKRVIMNSEDINFILKKILHYALVTSIFTFFIMSILWGRTIPMLFDSNTDFVNLGIPFILYDPKISFIGWLFLMIFISPFLQLLTTIFTSYLTLLKWLKNNKTAR
ncbi:MAG: hypothetical protein IBV53_08570 [Candidatus Atribacteria bacterium]